MLNKTIAPFSSKRTGIVTIRDFDIGMLHKLGFRKREPERAEFKELSLFEPLLTSTNIILGYTVVPGINSNFGFKLKDEVNLVVQYPDFSITPDLLPVIVLTRDTIDFDGTRNFGWEAQYQDAAKDSNIKQVRDVIGFDKIVVKTMAMPIDIYYNMYAYGRFRAQTNLLFHWIMSRFQFMNILDVKDSLGDIRHYHTNFQGFGEISEVVDVGKKIIGYSIVVIVRGEIDVNDEIEYKTMLDYDINFENF